MLRNGTGQSNLSNSSFSDSTPEWSPDGSKVAFVSNRAGNLDIFVMNADGTGVADITNNPAGDFSPSWSPDGTRLAFVTDREGMDEIWTMKLDGSDRQNLSQLAVQEIEAADFNPAWSPDGTKIAFSSNRRGDEEIYLMDAVDGSGVTNLTKDPGNDSQPAWAIDGARIFFSSDRGGNRDIYRAKTDGTNLLDITGLPGDEISPQAAPDGQRIVFASDTGGDYDIYEARNDGSDLTNLTNNAGQDTEPMYSPNGLTVAFASDRTGNTDIYSLAEGQPSHRSNLTASQAHESQPAWSPDGTQIAFATDKNGNSDVYVMNADGSGATELTSNAANDSEPTWSSYGTKIAFVTDRNGNSDVYVMNADGSGATAVTSNAADDSEPTWSSDGTKIAFVSDRSGNRDVYVMNADGSAETQLTANPADDSQPDWSPDGGTIAFVSDRAGNRDVYLMNADGSGVTDLTSNPAEDYGPAFAPDRGVRLAFVSDRNGSNQLFFLNVWDGSGQVQVTGDQVTVSSPDWQPLPARTPAPVSPIKHVVVIFQENHSFDNVLGQICSLGRCDGVTVGQLSDGSSIPLRRAKDMVPGVQHIFSAQTLGWNDGQMNGFDLIKNCNLQHNYPCMQQFSAGQIPNLWSLAQNYAISDATFANAWGPSWVQHMTLATADLHGFLYGRPGVGTGGRGPGWGCDGLNDATWQPHPWQPGVKYPTCVPASDGTGPYKASPVNWSPTIMDRLDEAGGSWKIYTTGIHNVGYSWAVCPTFADCIYTDQAQNMVGSDKLIPDAQAGNLADLSLVMPKGTVSQHNGNPMSLGDNYIGDTVDAIMSGPDWSSTAIFITYDECGCFYDHVAPPYGLGLRVPMVIVSPYAKAHFNDSNVASFASILAYTEHNFGLAPTSWLDADSYDFSDSFDYSQKPLDGVPLTRQKVPAWELRWIKTHKMHVPPGE